MKKINKIQYLVIILGVLWLGACGVKPDFVDPPASVTTDTFPQTYPPEDADIDQPDRYLPPGYKPGTQENAQ